MWRLTLSQAEDISSASTRLRAITPRSKQIPSLSSFGHANGDEEFSLVAGGGFWLIAKRHGRSGNRPFARADIGRSASDKALCRSREYGSLFARACAGLRPLARNVSDKLTSRSTCGLSPPFLRRSSPTYRPIQEVTSTAGNFPPLD